MQAWIDVVKRNCFDESFSDSGQSSLQNLYLVVGDMEQKLKIVYHNLLCGITSVFGKLALANKTFQSFSRWRGVLISRMKPISSVNTMLGMILRCNPRVF